MSEHVGTVAGVDVSTFYGGSGRGRCVQLTIDVPGSPDPLVVVLVMEDAVELLRLLDLAVGF